MRQNSIQEGIARQLKDRAHATGTLVSYEQRGGRITMTSHCNNCGGPHSNISLTNAAQAVQNSQIPLINCQHCTRVIPAPAKLTYEDILRIPENQRTSEQDRIVLEHEFAVRNEEREREKNAPALAARAEESGRQRSALWDQWERFLTALAHEAGVQPNVHGVYTITDPRVARHPDFRTFDQWCSLPYADRERTNHIVSQYFVNHGLR